MRLDFIIGIGETGLGQNIPTHVQDQRIQHILKQATGLFGGATFYPGAGAWLNDDGRVTTEPAITVTVFTDDTPDAHAKAEQLAEISREAFEQNSVMVIQSPTAAVHFHTAAEAVAV